MSVDWKARAEAAEAQVAELQQKSIATRAFDCKELEAQVAELKKDAERSGRRKLVYNKTTRTIDVVGNGLVLESFDPPDDTAKESGSKYTDSTDRMNWGD